eukprot:CAMPEP_0173425560 /NCGR_PEP_ID=MMETSP1357-20121228/5247_1 /TAXON_ID=77926 /ORGANISM="Hemiselmis rufescens, Strain PCC563" /LENGTH=179 /DNA_ID=CAMNT_0014389027 /DNA_START=122 /DNA_END=661 /DNA_ORIENTATION=-
MHECERIVQEVCGHVPPAVPSVPQPHAPPNPIPPVGTGPRQQHPAQPPVAQPPSQFSHVFSSIPGMNPQKMVPLLSRMRQSLSQGLARHVGVQCGNAAHHVHMLGMVKAIECVAISLGRSEGEGYDVALSAKEVVEGQLSANTAMSTQDQCTLYCNVLKLHAVSPEDVRLLKDYISQPF